MSIFVVVVGVVGVDSGDGILDLDVNSSCLSEPVDKSSTSAGNSVLWAPVDNASANRCRVTLGGLEIIPVVSRSSSEVNPIGIGVDAVEEPEEQEEEEEEEMQQAIVVRDFVCSATMVDSECVSISEGEYVYVILYDIDSGWAGVLKVNGQKGYVPIYCIVRKMSRLKSEKVEENIGQEVTFESTSTTCNSTQERRRGRRRSLKMSPQMNDDDSLDHVRKK